MGEIICGIICFLGGLIGAQFCKDKQRRNGEIISYAKWRFLLRSLGTFLAAFLIFSSCFVFIPTGYTGIITTFGKVHDTTLDAGISFKAPYDRIIKMDNREQRFSFELSAFSSDIQEVDVKGSVNLNIDKKTAMNLYREVGVNYIDILVNPRVQENIKEVFSQYTAERLIAERNNVSEKATINLRESLANYGVNILAVTIEDIDFTDAFTNAVEAKQVATQEKQRAQTEQERQTMEAEQAAKRQKIVAEAEAEVARIQAEADAYALQVKAEAEADANKKISASLTEELIKYNYANNWNGQLPQFITGEMPIPMLNLNE